MYEVRLCKYGRGLFATRPINKGVTIATNHVVKTLYTADPMINSYCFDADNEMNCYIALGDISLVNHSKSANAHIEGSAILDPEGKVTEYEVFYLIASRNIKKGAQIFYDYGYNPIAK